MKLHHAAIAPAMALIAAGLSPAEARDLRVAPGVPPAHPGHYAYEKFAEYLKEESGGALGVTVLGPEVVSLLQSKDALQSGLAEMASLIPMYYPAEMPATGVAGDLALIGRDPDVMGMAMTEFAVTCEPCQAEFTRLGMVFLGSGSSNAYTLMTAKPVRNAADLRGLRLRTGGAPYARWAEHFGATPVSMAAGEQFEAISQGTIDGTIASSADMLSLRLIDAVSYVTRIPVGTYHITSNFTAAKSSWDTLTPDERRQVAMAASRANFDMTRRWAIEMPAEVDEALKSTRIEVIEPDPALLADSEAFARADTDARIAATGAEAERFRDLVAKWQAIVDEAGGDRQVLVARMNAEVWDKVDFARYGQ